MLLHSPLVGPYTWEPVADQLRQRGLPVMLPALTNFGGDLPFWKQHVRAVASAVQPLATSEPIILVGHSGAGVILPAIGEAIKRPVAAYVLVDSDMPRNGRARLDRFSKEDADLFRSAAVDGAIPPWTEERLVEAIPDPRRRARFASELRPTPLGVYQEPLSVPAQWPDAPCAYLSFAGTGAYAEAVREVREKGWDFIEMNGLHFHMLVDPAAVAEALVRLVEGMGVKIGREGS